MRIYILFALFLCARLLPAQQADTSAYQSMFALLQQQDTLHVEIETDLKQLKKGGDEPKWQPGVFRIMKNKKTVSEHPIKIKARGAMRRETCSFPPVKIKFHKYYTGPENDSIEEMNEIKVVTSCQYNTEAEALVAKEYLAYELYNILTDQSFRVKKAMISFKDPDHRGQALESFSFFIESEQELAARLDLKPIKQKVVSVRLMDSLTYDRMSVFQFMVGNTDWSIYTRHNVKALFNREGKGIAVPYDFDYAGMVDAPYAVPGAGITSIQSVRDRYYLGRCRSNEEYDAVFKLFKDKKKALLAHCEQSPVISKNDRANIIDYLTGFYDIIESPRLAERHIVKHCDLDKKKN